MSFSISVSSYFAAEAKRLSKKYHSFKDDLKALELSLYDNPFQGIEISPNIRKIRLQIKSKGKGKSGGARVITYNVLTESLEGQMVLLLIYDKEDADNIKLTVVKKIISEL